MHIYRGKDRFLKVVLLGLLTLLVLCFLDLGFGGTQITFREILSALFGADDPVSSVVLYRLRLPRMITAAFAGVALSIGGMMMQSVFRNPLADPHIMGVSAGAGFGAAIATAVAGTASATLLGGLSTLGAAFVGAAVSTLLILLVSSSVRSSSTMLIFGVMLGFVFSALTSITEYFASEQSLKVFYSWSAGSFSSSGAVGRWILLGSLSVGVAICLSLMKGLDILLFGDEYADLSGAPSRRIRVIALVATCLMTGGVTAVCGPIGFVGIVSAHVARRILRTSLHRQVIPVTVIVGACFAVAADLLSQVWPSPLPAGSVMAIIGSPLVMMILLKDRQ